MTRASPTRPRSTTVVSTLAVLVALWLGLAAPETSPVAPAVGVSSTAPAASTVDDAAPDLGDLELPDRRGGRGRR